MFTQYINVTVSKNSMPGKWQKIVIIFSKNGNCNHNFCIKNIFAKVVVPS